MINLYEYLLCEAAPKTDDAIYYELAKHIWDYWLHRKKDKKSKEAQRNYIKQYKIDLDNPRAGYIRWAKHELYPIEDASDEVIPREEWDLKGICGETKKQIDHPHFEKMRKWLFAHYKPKHDILVIFPCSNKKPYFDNHYFKWYIERYQSVCDFAYVSNPGVIPNEYANYYPYRYYEWEEREEEHHKDENGNDVQGPLMDYYDDRLQERFIEWVKHFKYKRVLICCNNLYVEQFALNAKKENEDNINKVMTILTDKRFIDDTYELYKDTFSSRGLFITRMFVLHEFKDRLKRAVMKELSKEEKDKLNYEIAKVEWNHKHKKEGTKEEIEEFAKELRREQQEKRK